MLLSFLKLASNISSAPFTKLVTASLLLCDAAVVSSAALVAPVKFKDDIPV
jgi:hypothetical protein